MSRVNMTLKNTFSCRSLAFLCGLTAFSLSPALLASNSQIITVNSASAAQVSTISGVVIPLKEVTLTAQLPGRIERIAGSEGESFTGGQELVKINVDDLFAKRQQITAQMANAHAALQNAQVQYSRELLAPRSESPGSMPGFGMPIMMDNMFTRNVGDMMGYGDTSVERHADLYSARTGIDQAQAGWMQSQSALQELDTKIRDSSSIAPFDGVILKKMIEVGDTVQPGQPLLAFGHIKYLRIQSEVPAGLAANLQVEQLVPIELANGETTQARVAQVYPMADATNHTVTVKFDLPTHVAATPGMYVELTVPGGGPAQNIVTIPATALIAGRSLPQVLVINKEGLSSVRLLRLGQRVANNHVVVLSGLKSGMQLIDNPPSHARSGWMPGSDSQ